MNITIVGLGLMGGSLAGACRKRFPQSRIIGVSRSTAALRLARRKKWIHEGTRDLKSGIQKADLIILCTPVDTLQKLLRKIESAAKRPVLVTDVGSVKGEILRWAGRQRFKKVRFVGAHPMTGSHERGIGVARSDLYNSGFTFVIRSPKSSAQDFSKVKNFWKKISPKVFITTAEAHDTITSEISHLPHLVAVCLVLAAGKKSLRFAGPGFSEATRIAQGDASLWFPIFRSNRRAVLKALALFETQCRRFRQALQKSGSALQKMLARAAQRRRQISL